MSDSRTVAASQAMVRLVVSGVAATICTIAAVGAWVSLALDSVASPNSPPSGARQRRGRAM